MPLTPKRILASRWENALHRKFCSTQIEAKCFCIQFKGIKVDGSKIFENSHTATWTQQLLDYSNRENVSIYTTVCVISEIPKLLDELQIGRSAYI